MQGSSPRVQRPARDGGASVTGQLRTKRDRYTERSRVRSFGAGANRTLRSRGVRRWHEHIACAAHCANRLRMLGVGLDLAPYACDADVDRAIEGLPLAIARKRQQLVPVQYLIRP